MNERLANTYGIELLATFEAPDTETLVADWQLYSGGEVIPTPNVYGAMRVPDHPPAAYASVDLCEVLRETSLTLRRFAGRHDIPDLSPNNYAQSLGTNDEQLITNVVQNLMHHDLVPPVAEIAAISNTLRNWREQGVYVVANTSTLPGCEIPTRRFLQAHLPGSFDAILFPRNHCNTLPTTKGIAARWLTDHLAGDQPPEVIVHIDDLPLHNVKFHQAFRDTAKPKVFTIRPEYPTHQPADIESIVVPTPLAAFQSAHMILFKVVESNRGTRRPS